MLLHRDEERVGSGPGPFQPRQRIRRRQRRRTEEDVGVVQLLLDGEQTRIVHRLELMVVVRLAGGGGGADRRRRGPRRRVKTQLAVVLQHEAEPVEDGTRLHPVPDQTKIKPGKTFTHATM